MTESLSPPAQPQLLRVLGLSFGLAVVVGGMLGQGIMRAPGLVAQGIGIVPLILLAWAAGGAVTMLSAMPVVEVGAAVPRAGGPFPIAERAFGRTAGSLTGWMAWLSNAASNGYISLVFGEYVHRLGLATPVPTGALACGLILAVAAINWTGTRTSGVSQSIATALKGAAFVLLAAFLFVAPHAPLSVVTTHPTVAVGLAGVVMAIRVIYATYSGWEGTIFFSEEVHRPEKNLARSTFIGIGLASLLFVLLNAAVLHVLTPQAIAGSKLAVGDAAKAAFGAAGIKCSPRSGSFRSPPSSI